MSWPALLIAGVTGAVIGAIAILIWHAWRVRKIAISTERRSWRAAGRYYSQIAAGDFTPRKGGVS